MLTFFTKDLYFTKCKYIAGTRDTYAEVVSCHRFIAVDPSGFCLIQWTSHISTFFKVCAYLLNSPHTVTFSECLSNSYCELAQSISYKKLKYVLSIHENEFVVTWNNLFYAQWFLLFGIHNHFPIFHNFLINFLTFLVLKFKK